MSVKGDQVSKISFNNKKTRLAINNVAHLISFPFSAPEDDKKKRIWMKLIRDYRDAMNILWKCTEYTAEDIRLFQVKINDFFSAGAGKEGVTSYIHMLGSGHITYYMKAHGNLHKYLQQGWESLNKKFKLAFFNHTQCDGNFGIDVVDQEKSYLIFFMYFQREVLSVSGVAEEHFLTQNVNE
jgi:hypothetical protein